MVVNKKQKRAAVVDVAIPSEINFGKKKNENVERYQRLKEELEQMWKVKARVN